MDAAPKSVKVLQLELLRHAIETGPNQLWELLAKVVELPKREQDDLTKLLEETTLSSIISAAKVTTDRLNFLRDLYQIVYAYEKDGQIKERSQLHRILALNSWLFGEEYVVSVDDRDLTAALKARKKHLDHEILIDDSVTPAGLPTKSARLFLATLHAPIARALVRPQAKGACERSDVGVE